MWVQASTEEMFDALRGRLLPKIVAHLKIRDYRCNNTDTVLQVTSVQRLTPVNSGRLLDQHGLVTV